MAFKCDIKRVLSITFPELERTMGIFTRTTLHLLCRFPSARALAQAGHDELARLLQSESRGAEHACVRRDTLGGRQIFHGNGKPLPGVDPAAKSIDPGSP
jgi:hypothetical protein